MTQPDVVKPDVKPSRNGPVVMPSFAPGCLPSCCQCTGCLECKHACKCEKVGPPCRTSPGFPHSPDGGVSGGSPISLLQPWRSGHLLPASTHTYTHCLLLLLLLWERRHALKSQAGFPEENLVFKPPPVPSTHLMQINDSPDANVTRMQINTGMTLRKHCTFAYQTDIGSCWQSNVTVDQGCHILTTSSLAIFFFYSDAEKRDVAESKAVNLHYLQQTPFSLSLKGLILFPLWSEETRPGRCICSTWRRDQNTLIRSDSADLQRDVRGKCEACLRAHCTPWMSNLRWQQHSSWTKIQTWFIMDVSGFVLHQELVRKNSFRETSSYKASQLFTFNSQTTYELFRQHSIQPQKTEKNFCNDPL